MPLQTANQYPGLFATPDKSGLAQGVFNAITGAAQKAERDKAAQLLEIQGQLRATGSQFMRLRDMLKPNMSADQRKATLKKIQGEMAALATEARKKGRPNDIYEKGVLVKSPDDMVVYLARNIRDIFAADKEIGPKLLEKQLMPETKTLSEGQRLITETGETIAEYESETPPGYKFVKDYPLGGGQFAAAYVPDDPNGQVIRVGKPYEKKALIDQTINTGADLPANHEWIDPNDKSKGVKPIKGGPADPAVKQEKDYDKAIINLDRAGDALDRYEALLDRYGTGILPSSAKQTLGSAYAAMQLEAKNLFELGVLAGPDIGLIERVLTDPASIEGKAYEFFGGKEGFKDQINIVRDVLKSGRDTAERLYGKSQGGQNQVPQEYPEGTIIKNSRTGERMIMRGGQWQKM